MTIEMKKYAVVRKYYWICRIENDEVLIDPFCSKTTAMAFFKSAKKQGKKPYNANLRTL